MSVSMVLADTNVISEFVKKTPHPQGMQWLKAFLAQTVSVVTLE